MRSMNRTPRSENHRLSGAAAPIDLAYPFTGNWLVQNSPADRVPSHGTYAFATAYAIDFLPVTDAGRTAPITPSSLVRPELADRFPGFGRPILTPVQGIVLAVHDSERDHATYRGLPSIRYALTQNRRVADGWASLAGNHVLIDSGGIVIALCHLQRGSIQVARGQQVRVGEMLARCGNSGNSTEPHLHVQVIDNLDIARANAVRMTFNGSLPVNGEVIRVDDEGPNIR